MLSEIQIQFLAYSILMQTLKLANTNLRLIVILSVLYHKKFFLKYFIPNENFSLSNQ